MFALGCFQSFGRTQDGQHRSFIEAGWREGWWRELAESRPPENVQSWLDRLERWSAPEKFDQVFHPWRRTLVDCMRLPVGWMNTLQSRSKCLESSRGLRIAERITGFLV